MNWYSTLYISNHFETNGPVRGVTWVGWPAAASLTSCECADDRNFKIVVILRVELAMLQKYIQYGGNEPRVTNLYVLQTSVLIIWTHLWQFFTKLDRRALTIEILSFDWIFFYWNARWRWKNCYSRLFLHTLIFHSFLFQVTQTTVVIAEKQRKKF